MTPKHTPEPWSFSGVPEDKHVMARTATGRITVAIVEREEDKQRIVACVNALAGLNPEAVADALDALEFYADEVPSTAADQDAGKKARAALAKLKS